MGNRWGNSGNSVRLYFLGSKITADGDGSSEMNLGRKAMTNLDSILKNKDVTLLTKVHIVKTGFSGSHVWMWELDSKEEWAPKNWCFCIVLEKTLESPLDSRSKQSILKEINPEYSLEGLILKLQYFDHLMRRADSLEKTLMLRKMEGRRRMGRQKMRWLDGITYSMNVNLSKLR